MISIDSSVVIYRPAGMVFDFISSASNDFEWQYGTLASGPTSAERRLPGDTFQTVGHLMGHRMQSTFEVTHFDANRQYGFKSLSGPLHLNTMFTLEVENGSTRLNVATQASPTNAITAKEHLIEKYMQKQLRDDLALLKELLEARSSLMQQSA